MTSSVHSEVNTRIWKYFGNQGKNGNFLYWTPFFVWGYNHELLTLATFIDALKCVTYPFLYQILFQWKFFICHCIKKNQLYGHAIFYQGLKEGKRKTDLVDKLIPTDVANYYDFSWIG
jgi:hypothetical protein